jgi:hypothetical protein
MLIVGWMMGGKRKKKGVGSLPASGEELVASFDVGVLARAF